MFCGAGHRHQRDVGKVRLLVLRQMQLKLREPLAEYKACLLGKIQVIKCGKRYHGEMLRRRNK